MVKKAKINEIKVNPNNPRLIKDDKFKKLVKSIKEFPEMLDIRPIVVNKEMIILGGNMRYKACKEAGLKEVPIIITDLTDEKQKEFLIKDNISGGEWDFDILANEWNSEELETWGLDLPIEFNTEILEAKGDKRDLSDNLQLLFRLEIELENEEEQEKMYNQLIKEGYKCRILTL